MSRELGDHLDTRPQSERLAAVPTIHELSAKMVARNSNEAVTCLIGFASRLEAEYGPLESPMPWWKRKFYRWTYKLKAIIEVIKE
jgi:hypothetical protein